MLSPSIQQQRAQILDEMGRIDQMIRGHVSEQTYQIKRGGQIVTQGPYFVLQRRENGKNNCQRVAHDEVQSIVSAVEAYQRFQQLAQSYAALTEEATWNQQKPEVKKKFRRFWRRISLKPSAASRGS
jgi:hypothetical protein